MIHPGATVGRNSVVAANAVVCDDVTDFMIVAGILARTLREV